MARKVLFAAGVLSLILVGTWGTARADSALSSNVESGPGFIRLFGSTICLAHAPPDTKCDWRLPALEISKDEPSSATGTAFTLFGQRYCFGDDVKGPCDFRIPANRVEANKKRVEANKRPRAFRLFGLSFCFEDLSSKVGCDWRLPVTRPEHRDARAGL